MEGENHGKHDGGISRTARARKGTYAEVFWKFYRSESTKLEKAYGSIEEARKAQTAVCGVRCRKNIYDVMITRRKNVLYLEKTGGNNA